MKGFLFGLGFALCIVGLLGFWLLPLPILLVQGIVWFWTAEWPSWSLWGVVVQPATTLGWPPVDWFWSAPLALSLGIWSFTTFMIGQGFIQITQWIEWDTKPLDIDRPWNN